MTKLAYSAVEVPVFEERQRFRQPALWLTLVGVFGAAELIALVAWLDTGSRAALIALIAAGAAEAAVIALFAVMSMRVRVYSDAVSIDLLPFYRRRIPLRDIRIAHPSTYRPIREFGGWGIRFSLADGGRAYNVSGNGGVQLEMASGDRILIGSQRAQEVADAINRARVT